jgi:hypothetical protein
VDTAFGRLLGQLKQRDDYADLDVILLSDHNMTNYLIRGEELEPYTDILTVLGPELTPKRNFHMFGAGSLAYLFWRPEPFVGPNPPPMSRDEMIEQARAKLMQHKTPHPVTGESECPWFVLDRAAMEAGSNGIGIGPMEFLNTYYAANKVWPDLVLLARDGWHLPGGNGHVDLPDWIKLRFNAGHGSVDTARVMLAVKGLGFSAGARCAEEARLSDVGVTLLQTTYASTGEQFPYSVGKMLTCTPTP